MDEIALNRLACFQDILAATQKIRGFPASGMLTWTLLRTLTASKPGGTFLEIGTGTGLATAWIVDGMDVNARLITVKKYGRLAAIAKRFLGYDSRISFQVREAEGFITDQKERSFDLIFVDAAARKFHLLAETLHLLKSGGFYLIDHLLPLSPSMEDQDHMVKIDTLLTFLEQQAGLSLTKMNWSTGLLLATKR